MRRADTVTDELRQTLGERLHALDGLRAVATLLVVAHHLGAGSAAQWLRDHDMGFIGNLLGSLTASGVELFFVLSAIVLAGPYVRYGQTMNLQRYALRRIERLMPPYLVAWLLAGGVIYQTSMFPTWWTVGAALPEFSLSVWFSQIAIIHLGGNDYNFAWWSLKTEVAFYLLLPVLIPVFARIAIRNLPLAFGVSVMIAVFLEPWLSSIALANSLALYASCFCAGLFLAKNVPNSYGRAGLASLGLIWVLASCRYPVLNVHVGWGLVYFALVAEAMDRHTTVSRCLSSYAFVWLGERSYSLFLVHYSVIALVCHAASLAFDQKSVSYFVVTRVLSVLLSLAAAIFLFQLVERRFARHLQTAGDVLPKAACSLGSGMANHIN